MSVASASQSGVTANRPDEPAEPRKDRLITRDVALVMLATFFFMTSNMVITPVIAGYGESMGATGALMGVIAGAMSFVSLFCRPIAGNLSDLVSKRLLVAAGTVLYIVAGAMYCLADSTGMLVVARMVNGLGFACGTVCLATWVSLLLPIRHMGAGVEPRAIPLAAVFMMFAIPYFANQSFLVDYISARHLRISSDLFFVFYAAALLVLRLTLRDLFDSKGFRFWLVVCSFAMLASLAFLTFMTNDWYLLGAGIAMAASYGLMSSVTQAQAVVIAGRERSGLANGTYYMGIDLGMALGPVLAGVLYGHLPIAWFYPLFMLALPVSWLIYLSFHRLIHPSHK